MIVCLGDLVLDVVVRLEQPLAPGGDTRSRITLSAGGQAANVAAWVSALGGDGRWLGKRAADPPGDLAARELERRGVTLLGPVAPIGNGVIVSLVDQAGERSMLPDRGVATTLGPGDLEEAWLACDHLHVSGYALFVEPSRSAAVAAVHQARQAGARISVDLSSWSGLRDAGPTTIRTIVSALEPDAIFANEDEARVFGGPVAGAAWILKRGAAGCSFDGDQRAALPAEVIDTTGAGDALAAGWIVGGPDLALEAAARCVATVGAMP